MSEDFAASLNKEIQRISKRTSMKTPSAFVFWFAIHILELSEDDAREAISVEGANDKGIDLIWIDDDEGRVIIAQSKFSSSLAYRAKESDLAKLESSLNWLANPEALRREGKPELAQAAQDYCKAVQDGYGVELWYVYTGPRSANVEKHIGVYNQNPDNLTKRRAFRHYHADILQATWEELQGSPRRIPSGEVTIAGKGAFAFDGSFGEALVATVPGSEIVDLYEKHEERLFDRNIRLFLGTRKGSVNAGISETLADQDERGNFWAYNNGITVVCESFRLSDSTVKLTNFSIVNGCQTTVSLARRADAANQVFVLVRFIAASPEIVDDVIRFTNSQNPIRTWDIASQDKTQRRLKTEFGELSKSYIYLTRRGDRPVGDLKKFREKGKLRLIRVDIAGQYAAAFRGDPVLAYKYKAEIFSRYHDTVFPPDVRVEEILFVWTCGEACRVTVQDAIAKGKSEEVRILKKGGTLFILAVMSRIMSLRNGATYLKGLTEERASSTHAVQRLRRYAEYARNAYVGAVGDLAEVTKEELPTLIRSREFFQKAVERAERTYRKDAMADKWLSEALPKIH